MTVFELLSAENSGNIPPITYKLGGLIKLFIAKIPFNYGIKVFSSMPHRKYDTVYEFQKQFLSVVTMHAHIAEQTQILQEFFAIGGSEYTARQKSLSYGPAVEDNRSARDHPPPNRTQWSWKPNARTQSADHRTDDHRSAKLHMLTSHQPFGGSGENSDDEGHPLRGQPPAVQYHYDSDENLPTGQCHRTRFIQSKAGPFPFRSNWRRCNCSMHSRVWRSTSLEKFFIAHLVSLLMCRLFVSICCSTTNVRPRDALTVTIPMSCGQHTHITL